MYSGGLIHVLILACAKRVLVSLVRPQAAKMSDKEFLNFEIKLNAN